MRRLIIASSLAALLAGFGNAAAAGQTGSTVPLIVIKSAGETAALTRVVIHGRVFPFLIDTGAGRTLVTPALARQLHLRTVGRPVTVSGVGCAVSSRMVRLGNWRAGAVALPAITAVSTDISFAGRRAFGLLGADVLSRFGTATIDYRHAELTLG